MKLKICVLIFFIAAANFVFAESKSIEHYKRLIEKWGPVPSVFLETYKNNKLKSTVGFKAETAIEKIGDFIWGFRRGSRNPRLMACRSNQKVLAEAIRTYNQEQSDKIDNIIDSGPAGTMEKLVKYYLKAPIVCPSGSKFKAYGSLSNGGVLYCETHGPADDPSGFLLAAGMIKPETILEQALPIIVIVIGFVIVGVLLFKLVAKFAKKSPNNRPLC
jgi:hypothetical protein